MNNDDLSDEELMTMYQNGAEEAFTILYRRHSSKIYGYLKAKVRSREKAHDIFQEALIKIHRSKKLYNRTFPVLPWLFTITRSVLIDELRKEKRFELASQETQESMGFIPAPLETDLMPNLNQLPEKQRAAIQLRYVDEKTFEEIADHLETSPDNVRQIISRGVKKLRSILKPGVKND